MNRGFIKDILTLEHKYNGSAAVLPSGHINRIAKIIRDLDDDQKAQSQLYIEKFNSLIGQGSVDLVEINTQINELLEISQLGIEVVRHHTCKEVTEKLDSLVIKANSIKNEDLKKKVDHALTMCFRKVMPSLIAYSAFKGDVLADENEMII